MMRHSLASGWTGTRRGLTRTCWVSCRLQTAGKTFTWSSMRRCASARRSWWLDGSVLASVMVTLQPAF